MQILKILLLFVATLTVSCGDLTEEEKKLLQQKEAEENEIQKTSETTSAAESSDYRHNLTVTGYISPIKITVNSIEYKDSEDFYTKELTKLRGEIERDYPGYQLHFNADIGFKNFKHNMYIFVAPVAAQGVASETYVDSQGKFTFKFSEAINIYDMYNLRATKRISLTISNESADDIIHWCYNLHADHETTLDKSPILLRNFTTTVTQYQCENSTGIVIPKLK